MKSNEELQLDVQDAIKWQPLLKAAEIGVTAKDGIVTLSGTVNSFTKKMEAENAAKNVIGVRAVVEEIDVDFENSLRKRDEEIAEEALSAMKWNWSVPDERIKLKVEDSWVTLEGSVEWNYQREAAQKCVSDLIGVKGVTNKIKLESKIPDVVERTDIENALSRSWLVDDRKIKVSVNKNKVTLRGSVESLFQKDEAERLAWNAPGVIDVVNELAVLQD
jgi:osmotically-inducible protein OsmY